MGCQNRGCSNAAPLAHPPGCGPIPTIDRGYHCVPHARDSIQPPATLFEPSGFINNHPLKTAKSLLVLFIRSKKF
jgi:hypothetical protein